MVGFELKRLARVTAVVLSPCCKLGRIQVEKQSLGSCQAVCGVVALGFGLESWGWAETQGLFKNS